MSFYTTSAGCTSLEYTPPSSSFGFYSVTPSGKSSTSARTFKGLIKGDERGTFTVEDTVSGKTASVKKLIQVIQGCTITSTPFSSRSIQKGTTQNLNIAGGFTAKNCSTLTYSATSSKPAIATVSGFGSGDATGTLSGVDFGATVITVTATSGTTSESRSFTLTVPACTITSTAIANRSVQVGKAIAMNVVGSFTARNCGTLTYAVTPTKTATATASGYGSNDGAGSLTGVAAGSTLITVTASSGGTTESRTFTLTVTAAPVCSITSTAISNRSVQVGKAIAMNVVGSFTARNCGTLTYAVTPTKTATATASGYGSNDGAGSLTGVAAGSTLITVTASSGGTTESRTFTLTVTVAPPARCPAGQIGTPPNCTTPCTITSTLPSSFSVGVGKKRSINFHSYFRYSSGCPSYPRVSYSGVSSAGYFSFDYFYALTGAARITGKKKTSGDSISITATAGAKTLRRTTKIVVTGGTTVPPPPPTTTKYCGTSTTTTSKRCPSGGTLTKVGSCFVCRVTRPGTWRQRHNAGHITCPSNWNSYLGWSSTQSTKCSDSYCCGSCDRPKSCTASGRAWSNGGVQTCRYNKEKRSNWGVCSTTRITCTATRYQIGCVPR